MCIEMSFKRRVRHAKRVAIAAATISFAAVQLVVAQEPLHQAPDPKRPAPVLRTAEFGIPDELYSSPFTELPIITTIQGTIVQTLVKLNFETVGEFDAAYVALGLQHGNNAFIINGADLGWSGSGHFVAEVESHLLDGEIQYYGNPWATFLMYESTFPWQGGDIVGMFDKSAFVVRYIPDCPLDVTLDKVVDESDVKAVRDAVGTYNPELDVTGDGWVTKIDVKWVEGGVGTVCVCPQCR